jgi:conjugal transfer pilus assembly protein TraW
MTFTTALLISTLVLTLAPLSQGWAKDLGTFGAVYPIAEPDSLAELKEKAAKVDWKRHLDREKLTRKVRNYKPSDLKRLPATARDRAFLSDLSYTLDVDIPDGKRGILYPKGYTFNPLDYIQMRRTIVVIDGKDRRQVEWFRKSPWFKDLNAMLLLTDGRYFPLGDRLRRPVFYANALIVERLGLRAVPSVARQKGRYMEVREYAVQ